MNDVIRKAIDPSRLAGAAFTALLGFAAIGASAIGMRFAYRNLALPEWAVYAFGALLVIIGVFNATKAFKALQCAACTKTLEEGRVIFPGDGEREGRVLQAVKAADIAGLRSVLHTSEDWSLNLQMHFCDACQKVASVTLLKDDKAKLVDGQIWTGATAGQAIALLKEHGKMEDD
ncbi:hypothetical protein AKJ09_10668 [Labilithrix luteola]|uniref:Transmembrane protein n=1 Tax=Labilithrix luteola TaxID=1391654 RepID=A0A0K1QEZ2_9BACT|nr:hypothetical protein [Labilithrix luteola]AKV04005.1 hypothetical protein AKJ09_10668 [Labilithrix luteola]